MRGNLYVISGPAGAGKSEIVKKVLAEHPNVRVSVSCTTRSPRPGEVNGVSYFFVDEKEFDRMVDENAFYEWAHVHQDCYGTPKAAVAQMLDAGYDVILEIDVQGCLQVMRQNPDVTSIFISPPSRENLEKRLRGRGTETEESIRVRLGNVASEVAQAYHYDYIIIHQDWADVPNALDIAANEVYGIMAAKHCELSVRKNFLDTLSASLNK